MAERQPGTAAQSCNRLRAVPARHLLEHVAVMVLDPPVLLFGQFRRHGLLDSAVAEFREQLRKLGVSRCRFAVEVEL